MKVKLEKQEDSRAGKVFLVLNYAGGDADTEHPEEYLIKDLIFEGGKEIILPEEVVIDIKNYKKLRNILDVNHKDNCDDYKEIKEKFGEEIADLFDNVPNDPQNDYQFKCYLQSLEIKAYDLTGTMYQSYDILR